MTPAPPEPVAEEPAAEDEVQTTEESLAEAPVEEPPAEQEGEGPAAEVPPETVELAEPVGEAVVKPEFDVTGLIESLTVAFEAALDDIAARLNGSSVLPPLSEPSGNGVACDKFLDIYNNLMGAGPADDTQIVEDVDVAA